MPALFVLFVFVAVYVILRLSVPRSPNAADIYRNHP